MRLKSKHAGSEVWPERGGGKMDGGGGLKQGQFCMNDCCKLCVCMSTSVP